MNYESAIYRGTIQHRRFVPKYHEFNYQYYMILLDLDEVDELIGNCWFLSKDTFNIAQFKRKDYLPSENSNLKTAVIDLIKQHYPVDTSFGKIQLLSQFRHFGYYFNPISIYYIYNSDNTKVQYMIADVRNTPWGEAHPYVMTVDNNSKILKASSEKKMHVSPFMPMDFIYSFCFTEPREKLFMHIKNLKQGTLYFDACLKLMRSELCKKSLWRVFYRYPMVTLKTMITIYWQAWKIFLKRIPFHPHPNRN